MSYLLDCLVCGKPFDSKYPYTRKCPDCKITRKVGKKKVRPGISVVVVRTCWGCKNEFELTPNQKYRYAIYCPDCVQLRIWRKSHERR